MTKAKVAIPKKSYEGLIANKVYDILEESEILVKLKIPLGGTQWVPIEILAITSAVILARLIYD